MLGPRELEVFVAVIDAGSITRAADQLFRSQPTVSRQLATLERQVGSQLFRRTTAGMTLTPVGERLEPLARDLLRRGNRATEVMQAVISGEHMFVVAAPEMTGILLLAPFAAAGGGIADLVIAPPSEVYGRLRTGADLAVTTSQPPPQLDGLRLAPLPVQCQVPADHPFAAHEAAELAEIVAQPFFAPGHGSAVWQQVREAAGDGFTLELATIVANAPIAQARAAAGHGPALVVEPPQFGLVTLPVVHRGSPLVCATYAGWEREHYARDDIAGVARSLRRFIRHHLTDLFAASPATHTVSISDTNPQK